jgi:hypothetical protein
MHSILTLQLNGLYKITFLALQTNILTSQEHLIHYSMYQLNSGSSVVQNLIPGNKTLIQLGMFFGIKLFRDTADLRLDQMRHQPLQSVSGFG